MEYHDLLGMHFIDNETYHLKTKGVNSSLLKECLKSEQAYRDYISGNKKKKTKKMENGSFVHDAILLPETIQTKYTFIEVDPDSSKKETEEYIKLLQEKNPDKCIVTMDEVKVCKAIKKTFFSHQLLRDIYDNSLKEMSYFVDSTLDPDDPHDFIIRKKCKPDFVLPSEGMVFDLKISESTDEDIFKIIADKLKYDLSGAWYVDIISEYYQKEFKYFGLIVIQNTFPHKIEVYILDQDAITRGRNRYSRAVARYKKFLMTNNDPHEIKPLQIKFLSMPKWGE